MLGAVLACGNVDSRGEIKESLQEDEGRAGRDGKNIALQ